MIKSILIILLLFVQTTNLTYSLKIESTSFEIEEVSYNGFQTDFIQPFEEMKKEWWKYIKARAVIFNHKTHLSLTIPTEKGKSNTPIKFISTWSEDGETMISTLKIALEEEVGNEDLNQKIKTLLKDFKIEYFSSILQGSIKQKEKTSKKISKSVQKLVIQNKKLSTLMEKNDSLKTTSNQFNYNVNQVSQLMDSLNSISLELEKFKSDLSKIK